MALTVICGLCWLVGIILTGYILVHGDNLSKDASGFLNGFALAFVIIAAILSGICKLR